MSLDNARCEYPHGQNCGLNWGSFPDRNLNAVSVERTQFYVQFLHDLLLFLCFVWFCLVLFCFYIIPLNPLHPLQNPLKKKNPLNPMKNPLKFCFRFSLRMHILGKLRGVWLHAHTTVPGYPQSSVLLRWRAHIQFPSLDARRYM